MGDDPNRKLGFGTGLLVGIFGIIAFAVVFVSLNHVRKQSSHESDAEGGVPTSIAQPAVVTRRDRLFSGEYQINAGQYTFESFRITPSMTGARIVGRFRAFGGSGNDIQAGLLDQMDFVNWMNGHEARAYYLSGQETVGEVNTGALPPGSYVFVFSNRFSAVSRKQVTAEIDLVYQQSE